MVSLSCLANDQKFDATIHFFFLSFLGNDQNHSFNTGMFLLSLLLLRE
jgi:hypothetical protein